MLLNLFHYLQQQYKCHSETRTKHNMSTNQSSRAFKRKQPVMSMLGLGSPRGHAVDPSTECSPSTPSTVMKAISNHELQKTEEFQRRIDKCVDLPSRTPGIVRLLPDPQFKIAQQSKGAGSQEFRFGGSDSRARLECVQRIALGGKVNYVDARVVGVPKLLLVSRRRKCHVWDLLRKRNTRRRCLELQHAQPRSVTWVRTLMKTIIAVCDGTPREDS